MALRLCASFAICSFEKMHLRSSSYFPVGSASPVRYGTVSPRISSQHIVRRSANYQPSIWDYDYVQSLRSEFLGEVHTKRINKLKEEVSKMVINSQEMTKPIDQVELIDTLQRLGLGYHFQDEIKTTLVSIFHGSSEMEEDLHATALQFRLLRQHGFHVPQEIFNRFKDQQGNFKASLCENLEGILSLYEASYLCEEGESVLEDARKFSAERLNEYVEQNKDSHSYLSVLISHALELPLHWGVPRLEARWFIHVYERKQAMNPLLLELAKLDFNHVQALHQQDLKYVSWWWNSIRLGKKLSFARNRLMQNFLWTLGIQFEPEYGYGRRMSTKVNSLITIIDDIYDVYGTLDELQHFTDAVERWDVNAIEPLPDYMKITFLALYNSINEMGFDALREQGFNIIPHLKKSWAELCKSYLLEAKWYCSGYMPTLQEYIDRAWLSISAPLILLHYYVFVENPITDEALECLNQYPDIIRYSSIILRLANDLGTSSDELKRGDIPKSIQCYMKGTGASEEEARKHIRNLIREAWMKINEYRVGNDHLSETFVGIAVNLARMAQCTYQHGDGHAVEDSTTKDRMLSLLVHPIPL
ncbi:hypothetical protein P3X46_010826 [Hevea brasiliensis]|uniref:Uncharacterized protein n=1 Tax=Hevea brasiliensis TaxID=3981 RepID=A0ABQ9MFN3_HEVBR|nr:terpene synthase 10-like [Hevea brasiliensis]KAJ9178991.1 hypothetical protein P3X46_010826 [Hevea brasiliensis]